MPVSQVGPLLAKQRSKNVCALANNVRLRPDYFTMQIRPGIRVLNKEQK
jgi:hypothetical protein